MRTGFGAWVSWSDVLRYCHDFGTVDLGSVVPTVRGICEVCVVDAPPVSSYGGSQHTNTLII
jgi:hypothetical protein